MWWSIFTVLAPSLFYFSVWQLSFSGQEVSLFATVSPILLGMTSVRTSLSSHSGRTWLQILSILGLVAYQIEHPLLRLLAVTCANISGSLLRAIEWSNQQEAERHGISTSRSVQCRSPLTSLLPVLALGLVVSSLSKLVNHTVNVGTSPLLPHLYSRPVIKADLADCRWSVGRMEQNWHSFGCPCRPGIRHA
jgi:PGAP2IP, first transmembrane domain